MDSATTVQAAHFTRDRPTWFIYLVLATFATYLYGLSAALPTLRAELGVSQAVGGLHGTAMAVGGVIAGLTLPLLSARLGRRATVWTGLVVMDAGILIVLLGHALPLTLTGFAVAGTAGSVTLYVVMAALSDHQGSAGPAAISEANAVAVIAGIAVSYLFSVVAGSAVGWRAALCVPILATALLAVTMGRVWIPARLTTDPPAPETSPTRRIPYGRRFHIAGAVLLCCVGLEFTFNLWAAELFAQQTGLTAAAAAKGLTAMLAGMAVGRFGGARLALRFRPAPLLLGALAVTLLGWALFWLSTSQPAGYAGLALSGLGISLHFPLALTRIIDASGGRPDQASGTASIWASVGSGGGPFVLGVLGDGFGTHAAFLLAPVLIGLAALGLLSSRPLAG
ncbi:sugar MFS transporter [Planotetraspora phitsanulokensis]|uniref:MFS transporter n=1 Tax=Planotetraspora phitsanulokensis TaxID=575192 RepID=A0A8J3XNR3_9ACTN|nr:MFS transporter [Planotetraspora phitsanulokensis]